MGILSVYSTAIAHISHCRSVVLLDSYEHNSVIIYYTHSKISYSYKATAI